MIYALFETGSGASSTFTANQQQIDEAWARLLEETDAPSASSFSSISGDTPGTVVIDMPLAPSTAVIFETSSDVIPVVTSAESLPLDDTATTTSVKSVIEPILDSVAASTSASTLDPSPYTPTVQNTLRVMFPGIKFNEVTSTQPSDKVPTLYEYIRDGNLATDVGKDMANTKENALILQSQVQRISQNLQDMIALDANALQENLSSWFKSIISSNTVASPFLASFPSALTNPNPTTATIIAAASTVTMLAIYTQRQEQQQSLRQQHQQEKQMEQQLKEANDKANQAVALAENALNDLTRLRQHIERTTSSTASQSLINKSKMEQLVIENDLYKQQFSLMERELQQLQAQLEKLLKEKLILEQYMPVDDVSEINKLQQEKQLDATKTQVIAPTAGKKSREEVEDKVIPKQVANQKSKKLPTTPDNKQPVVIDSPTMENTSLQEGLVADTKFQERTLARGGGDTVKGSHKRKRKVTVEDDAESKDNEVLNPVAEDISLVGSKGISTTQERLDEFSALTATEVVVSKKKSGTAKYQQEKQKLQTLALDDKVGANRKNSASKITKKAVKEAAKPEETLQEFTPSVIVEDSIYGKPHPWAALSDTTLSRKTISELASFLSDRGADITANGKPLSKKEILIKVRSML